MTSITVSNQAQLTAALANARGGETIVLNAGNYGTLNLNGRTYSSAVTLVSADPKNQAIIERVLLTNVTGVTFKSLDLGRSFAPGDADWTQLHNVNKSKNITFDGVRIHSNEPEVAKSIGWGLFVRDSADVTIKNSTFDHVAVGLAATTTRNLVVENNLFTDIRRDGSNFSELTTARIDGNTFTNMHPQNGEHPDAIQFLTAGTKAASTDISITNNVVMQGTGAAIQGIFVQDETGALPYERVSIKNNLVYVNGMFNGIMVRGAKDVSITDNTVLSRTDDQVAAWIRVEQVSGADVTRNVADRFVNANSTGVVTKDNLFINESGAALRALDGINDPTTVTINDLLKAGVGYQPSGNRINKTAAMFEADIGSDAQVATASLAPVSPVLDLRFSPTAVTDMSRFKTAVATAVKSNNIVTSGGESFLKVSTGNGLELSRTNTGHLHGMKEMTLSFSLKRDSASTGTGDVMRMHGSWYVTLEKNGELSFMVRNDAGQTYKVSTVGARLTDTARHDIDITFDGNANKASIYVDGVAKGEGVISGSTRQLESWGLFIGNPYGPAFSGEVGRLTLRDDALTAGQIAFEQRTSPLSLVVEAAGNGSSDALAVSSPTIEVGTLAAPPSIADLSGLASSTASLSRPEGFLQSTVRQPILIDDGLFAFHA